MSTDSPAASGPTSDAAATPDGLARAALRPAASAAPRPGVSSAAASGLRTGFGHDEHPFGPGDGLALGGIEIAAAPRLHGHSDGDVVLHAVCDALLGAAALGDLGRVFPAGGATPSGISSRFMLIEVARIVAAHGWQIVHLDVTIVGARPRLADHLETMAVAIAGLLELEAGAVSVKASTGNLLGASGAGRAIAADAVATLRPADDGAGAAAVAPKRGI